MKNTIQSPFFEGSRLTEIRVMPKSQTTGIAAEQMELRAKLVMLGLRAGVEIIDPMDALCRDGNCLRAMGDGRAKI